MDRPAPVHKASTTFIATVERITNQLAASALHLTKGSEKPVNLYLALPLVRIHYAFAGNTVIHGTVRPELLTAGPENRHR